MRHPASCGEREVAPPGHAGAADAPAGRPVSLHAHTPRCIDSTSTIKPLHPGTSPTTVQRTSKIYVGITLDAMPYVLGPPDESDLVVQRHLRLEEIVDATDAPFRFLLRWRRGGLLQLSGHVTLRKRLV